MNKLLFSFVAAIAAAAQLTPALAQTLTQDPDAVLGDNNKNRFGLSYRMGFNIKAEFRNLGGFAPLDPTTNPRNPLITPSGDLYNYDNGYVYPDDFVHPPGYTWYYGYTEGTPLTPSSLPRQFDLYRSSSPNNVTSEDKDGDPQHGMEATYSRRFGKVGRGFWGWETGLGFTDLTIEDSATLHGDITRAADTFRRAPLTGFLEPAPQAFPIEGPTSDQTNWPGIRLDPVSSSTDTFPGAATITGHRHFDAQVITLRFGPFVDIPISKRWMVTVSGGMAVLFINSDFRYDETVTLDPSVTVMPLPPETHAGSSSHSDVAFAGYFGTTFSFALNDRFSLIAGAQIQGGQGYTHVTDNKEADLNLGESVFVMLGATFSF
jgi:hypothetical protein